jgi:AcrR family transcriptional regulator
MEKQRARNADEKQQRRQSLIEATRELFEQTSYEAVTMAGVAEKVGLAKGTVFVYFKTKEELFLALQEQLLQEWFEEVDRRLAGLAENASIEQVAEVLCQSVQQRSSLTRLLAILHTTLEQNIDFATTLRFKQFLRAHLLTTGGLLEKTLPFLTTGQGAQVLLRIDALIIGLEHLAKPGPMVQQVLAQTPDLQLFAINFYQELFVTLQTLLYGMAQNAATSRPPLHSQ